MTKSSSKFSVKTTDETTDRTVTTTEVESFGDGEYILADDDDQENLASITSADTFSMNNEGISVYGKQNCAPWNLSWSGRIVTSRTFKRTVIVMIILNSISIALSTMDWVTDYPNRQFAFTIVNAIFLICFTLELFLRFMYAGPKFFVDGWNIFDLLVISSSWVVYPLLALRTFRIVRSLRLATRVRDLQYMVQALLASVPKMLCICFLLSLQFYTFSIVFTDLFKDTYKDGYTSQDYFGRLDTTCFTLFQIMTLDSWGSITKEVMQAYQWAWFPFVLFIMTTTFFFLNLIIAVICEAVSKVAHERQIQKLGRQMGLPAVKTDDSSVGSVVAMKTGADILRLEKKVDKLAKQVELLIRLQTEKDTAGSIATPHASNRNLVIE